VTLEAQLVTAVIGCAAGWVAAFRIMRNSNPMFKAFTDSKLVRSVIAAAAGACATAVPALVMGDLNAARVAVAAGCGACATVIALHFKSGGAA
jgi:hypothetical protein